MNGKVAKRMRKLFPPEEIRKYNVITTEKETTGNKETINVVKTTLVNSGNRKYYLAAKDAYKLGNI